MSRQILAHYDEGGVTVYQAFEPRTVSAALVKGTFGAGFSLDRMTWIKPSFGWMLYRSGYGRKPRQEAILRIRLTHAGFLAILAQSVATSYHASLYATDAEWQRALNRSEVRHQWDPDRSLHGGKLERRAIQIGIRGETVRRYVEEWIIGLEEVTALAHEIEAAVKARRAELPVVPEERVYPVDATLAARLGIDGPAA